MIHLSQYRTCKTKNNINLCVPQKYSASVNSSSMGACATKPVSTTDVIEYRTQLSYEVVPISFGHTTRYTQPCAVIPQKANRLYLGANEERASQDLLAQDSRCQHSHCRAGMVSWFRRYRDCMNGT